MNKVPPYQKPTFPNQNPVSGQAPPLCQPSPNCAQPPSSHSQMPDNNWFMDSPRLNHSFASDEYYFPEINDKNDSMKRHSSPLISPSAKPQPSLNDAHDENRKAPRAIGTERASWKHNVGHNDTMDKNDHALPPWILEKNYLQQAQQPYSPQMAQTWKPFSEPRTQFSDEFRLQEQHQVRVLLFEWN